MVPSQTLSIFTYKITKPSSCKRASQGGRNLGSSLVQPWAQPRQRWTQTTLLRALSRWELETSKGRKFTAKGNSVITGNSNMRSHFLLLLWIICLTEGQRAPISERHLSSQFWKEPRNILVKLGLLRWGGSSLLSCPSFFTAQKLFSPLAELF